MELAALAFPSHPYVLRRVPHPVPMEEQEAIGAGRVRIAGVETGDAGGGHRHEVVVSRQPLDIRVRPVGQEGEMDRAGGIGKVVDLESLDLLLDRLASRQQRRDGDQGAQMRRHPLPQVEAGQKRRAETAGDRAIDQHQRRIDRRQKTDQHHDRELPAGDVDLREHEQRQEENDRRRQGNAGDVAGDAARREPPAQRETAWLEAHGPLEGATATADQMIARIVLPAIAVACAGSRRCSPKSAARDFRLREVGATGHLLDGGAVEVAGGEIHRGEIAASPQDVVDRTHLLEQLRPIDVGD